MDILGNYEYVKEEVAKSAVKSGRVPEDITIIAVCKTVGINEVQQALSAGINNFAENRVQNFLEKYEGLSDRNIDWHLIGHLQTNKVKYILDKVKLIHSVDSIKLAEEIETQAKKINKPIDCLLQLNISGEEQKYGLEPENTFDFLEKVSKMEYVNIKGLMTMAPFGAEEKELRKIFSKTREMYVDIAKISMHNINMTYLSMGMSGDFKYAIEEGANMVRIGTSIFH